MYDLIYIYEFEGDLSDRMPTLKDADFIGFWKEAGYSFIFFGTPKKALLESLGLFFRSELVIRHEDWESGIPVDTFGVGRVTVYPPWKSPPFTGDVQICIDPNMAFGSGFHPTTKGCLALLQKLFERSTPATVLDLGTGTGILSIASLKMGARSTFSVDTNNLSIEVARKNRVLNGLEERMHLVRGDAIDFLHVPADLLIANIYFSVIDGLTRQDAFYTKRYYLISGLIRTEGHIIEERLTERLNLLERYSENLWFTYLFENPRRGSEE